MEIDLSHTFDAPTNVLWDALLDPQKMAKCVPGMQAVEVVSDTEYLAQIKVKIAFISASFRARTVIADQTPPTYLRCESTGEDTSVGSSVKSVTEMFLTAQDNDRTALRISSKVTVLGRLGTLGLNPMRTKAERMWEEFCRNLAAALAEPGLPEPQTARPDEPADLDLPIRVASAVDVQAEAVPPETIKRPGLLARVCRRIAGRDTLRVEIRRNETAIILHWPADRADQCLTWLDKQLGPS